MIPIRNKKKTLEMTVEEMRNFAFTYVEKYAPSKQQLKTYLLKKYLKTSVPNVKKQDVTIMLGRPDIGWKYFVAKGIMKESQMDLSDMAKPAAFISANGKLAEAGFATAEPFLYEVEIKEWGKPVKVQLLHDAGFPEYFQALAVKKEDRLSEHSPHLAHVGWRWLTYRRLGTAANHRALGPPCA